ncbi:hypothetical protein SOM46_23745 [Pseudomonas fluorescens]|uniref:hypothetical protein n=1 Tax=Pseudomonas fluorescens TaxID=294 RepID=UPI0017804E6D|nr:hypothetical protein [Pseudomonas fluorescens]MBD8239831.1 hypothetical protein [Pseudomonas fluorescens]MDY0897950.1 hypothetical protein [Pseudomonas fluorescens]
MGGVLITKSSIVRLMLLATFAFFIVLSYNLQLQEANQYLGYVPILLDLDFLARIVFGIVFLVMLVPIKIYRPSDFFCFFYGFFVLLPYLFLHSIRGQISFEYFLLYFSVLFLPLLLVRLMLLKLPVFRFPGLINQGAVILILCVLIIVGVLMALSNPTPSAGFDLSKSYERRLEGRDIFISGSFFSYFSTAIINGFSPLVAFWACWKRKAWLMAVPFLCWLAFFYLLGLKAPILFIAVAALLGYATRKHKIESFISYVYLLLLISFLIFIAEYASEGYSYVADYFIRRAFTVPSWVTASFFEFMNSDSTHWSMLTGIYDSKPISFVVGEDYLGYEGLNANSNAFMYALGSGGVILYLLTVALVGGVFFILDSAYVRKENPIFIYIGFSYSILVIEQAATTALLSSGVGLLIGLMVCTRKNQDNSYV